MRCTYCGSPNHPEMHCPKTHGGDHLPGAVRLIDER